MFIPLFSRSYLPNSSYLKEKADGKDWELRILSTYSTRKLRFYTVSHVIFRSFSWAWITTIVVFSRFYAMNRAIPLSFSLITSLLACLNYSSNKLSLQNPCRVNKCAIKASTITMVIFSIDKFSSPPQICKWFLVSNLWIGFLIR